ncbi:MAG: M23 family metallopeptidase, partial [Calditrichaeota bacterium]
MMKNSSLKFILSTLIILLNGHFLFAQNQFPWPVTPFNESHEITGNFCEYRSTSNPAHFHNGTDIPKVDGSPVYPVNDGTIVSIGTVGEYGNNAWVRVGDKAYVHIEPNPALSVGDPVYTSQTVLGWILPGLGHV